MVDRAFHPRIRNPHSSEHSEPASADRLPTDWRKNRACHTVTGRVVRCELYVVPAMLNILALKLLAAPEKFRFLTRGLMMISPHVFGEGNMLALDCVASCIRMNGASLAVISRDSEGMEKRILRQGAQSL